MEEDRNPWHLDRSISIGHILTTATVACSMVVWFMNMDSRVTVLEREIVHAQQSDQRLEQQLKDAISRIESAVIRIEVALREKADK